MMNWNSWFDHLRRDVYFSLRSLWKSPGFTLPAVVTLALGIGATTAIFSTVHSVLLKPLPYYNPGEIYSVEVSLPDRSDTLPPRIQDYLEWSKADTVFSGVAALTPEQWNITGDGEPERIGGALVSTNFFSFLGTPVARGRGFLAEEQQPGRDKVIIISDVLWRTRYAADPAMIGKSITLDGAPHQVVGITAPSIVVPTNTLLHPLLAFSSRINIWKPIAPTKDDLEGENWNYGLLVRLKPGANAEQGRLQLQRILNVSIRAAAPEIKIELTTRLTPIHEVYTRRSRLRLLLILGASMLLLLAACTNIVNLLLARSASQATEVATRIALGAGRTRVVTHMLSESVMLALIGGALGVVVAAFGTSVLLNYSPDDVRLLADARLNLPVLLFALGVSVLTGIVCGMLPASKAFRKDASVALQESTRSAFGGSNASGFHRILIGIEIALGTILLASAALLVHSFVRIMNVDRGYEIDHVTTADLSLSGPRYSTDQQRVLFYQQLTQGLKTSPGITAAGAVSSLPAIGESGFTQAVFYTSDTDFQSTVLHRPVAAIRSVTSGYFAATGTPLRAGRIVSEQDQIPVGMVSLSLAKRLWPGEAPGSVIGHSVRQGDVKGPVITIVGVVDDVRPGSADRDLPPQLYRPYQQLADNRMTVVVRTVLDEASSAAVLRSQVRRLEPNLPILSIQTMRQILLTSVAQRMFQMILTSVFAVVALVLGAIGVYGVVSYSVECKTREIGMRLALGAMRTDVMRWLFVAMFSSVVPGLIAGLIGAIVCATLFRSLLFEIGPSDPLSLGGVAAILLLSSALACYFPARRAARLNPMIALRHG